MTCIAKYFPVYEISKDEALKIQALMGFKPMTKYFPACKIIKEILWNIKARASGFHEIQTHDLYSKILSSL